MPTTDFQPDRLPEPLLAYDSVAGSLSTQLDAIDELRQQMGSEQTCNPSSNTAEAQRIEYTYHSNAIEGSTLTLRETQLIIEGNGRTARLMMNAWLLQQRYPLCIIEVERRAEYLTALDAANTGDPLPFAGFIAGCVERSLSAVLGDDGLAES